MKRNHFEKLEPVCPVCMHHVGGPWNLEIRSVMKESATEIIEGLLLCSNPSCLSEFPVIDGIPIILEDLRSYISSNILSIFGRRDLSPDMESLIGDSCGPGSAFDTRRQTLSTYVFDHFEDFFPEKDRQKNADPPSILRLAHTGLTEAMDGKLTGPVIDVGCGAGRSCFYFAEKTDALVVGIDMNFDMLRVASSVMRDGEVSYPKRRVGIVYEKTRFPVRFPKTENIDFWVCDATALPFRDNVFGFASSFNLLDCVRSPYLHLTEIKRILRSSGKTMITSPYDWSTGATPVEAWIGGHSQRSGSGGASEPMLRAILSESHHPGYIEGFRILSEIDEIPWSVRVHDRAVMEYQVHLVFAEVLKGR